MKYLIWATSLFVLFLLFLFPAVMALTIDIIPYSNQPGYDSNIRLSVYKQHDFKQYFVSQDDRLTAIGTSIRNPNLKNKKNIILRVFDEGDNFIRSSELSGVNIEDGDFVKFVFEPILESKGKSYYFILSSPDAGQEETIEVFIINPNESILNYEYLGERFSGGVPLVTFHKPENKLFVIKKIYSSWFSKFRFLGF